MARLLLLLVLCITAQDESFCVFASSLEYPLNQISRFIDQLLNASGVGLFVNGGKESNQGSVTTPVRATHPSIQNIIYYYFYALAGICESSLERWDCYYCRILGRQVQLISVTYSKMYHTKSFIALDKTRKEIVLSYRGGINLGNGLTTLNLVLSKVKNDTSDIRLHAGFLQSVEDTYEEILAKLRKLTRKYPEFKIVVTGLSLGGSQASIMLFLLKKRNVFPLTRFELYTYAQPRTGNRAFADYVNNLDIPIARVVQQNDFFVRMAGAALGFYHHQNEVFIEDTGLQGQPTIRFCSQEFYEDPECGQGSGLSLLLFQPLFGFIDHLTYFGLDTLQCVWENPVETILQAIVNLRSLIPAPVLAEFPKFAIDTRAVVEFRRFATSGLRNLYQAALDSNPA